MSKWKERLKKTRAVLANNSNNLVIQGLESGFRDDYEQAIEDFDEALYGTLRTTETSINANFYKAVALVELDRKDEAIEIFKNILKHDKDNDAAWQNLGYIYFEMENYDEAIKCFNRAVKLEPKEIGSLQGQSQVFFELKENKKALEIINKILKLDPDDTDALFLKCEILIEMNRSEEVLKIIKDLKHNEDIISEIKEIESLAHGALGNNIKALECINESIQFESDNEALWYNKACYLSLLDRKEEANDALLIATSIEPENFNEIENEKDFENIKNTERFKKLISQSV
jgi:tetratricopeptide (TPR) repeat protein